MGADGDQVPNTQKRPWQQHEGQAGADVEGEQARERSLARGRNIEDLRRSQRTSGFSLNSGCQGRHKTSVSAPSPSRWREETGCCSQDGCAGEDLVRKQPELYIASGS